MISEARNDHRWLVGKGQDYDLLGANQFKVLIEEGLREWHSVLDVGCGPLRLGRILIPWLQSSRYCGVDLSEYLIKHALYEEVGDEIAKRKAPSFIYGEDFPFEEFKKKFDFIVIHSVFIHMPLSTIKACLIKARKVCAGKVLFTYKPGPTQDAEGWVYPEALTHSNDDILATCKEAGFSKMEMLDYGSVNFHHQWWVACA